MLVYNSKKHLKEAISSIFLQENNIHLALGHHFIDSKNLTTVNVVHEHLLNIIN